MVVNIYLNQPSTITGAPPTVVKLKENYTMPSVPFFAPMFLQLQGQPGVYQVQYILLTEQKEMQVYVAKLTGAAVPSAQTLTQA